MKNGRYKEFSGTVRWYQNGVQHREDGPAVEYSDGALEWYRNGKLHRDGEPAVIWPNGEKHWFQNRKFHREDGPAIIGYDGFTRWYLNGVQYNRIESFAKDAGWTDAQLVEYLLIHGSGNI